MILSSRIALLGLVSVAFASGSLGCIQSVGQPPGRRSVLTRKDVSRLTLDMHCPYHAPLSRRTLTRRDIYSVHCATCLEELQRVPSRGVSVIPPTIMGKEAN